MTDLQNSKLTFTAFFMLLAQNGITTEQIADIHKYPPTIEGVKLGPIKLVDEKKSAFAEQVGDNDGIQGWEDDIHRVFHVEEHGFYFKVDGIADSYGNDEWQKMPYEVEPFQKEVTDYKKVPPVTAAGKLTFVEILATLRMLGVQNNQLGYNDDIDWEKVGESLGDVDHVKRWGGEGEGSSIGSVYHFVDHDVYLRIDGYYQSYEGADWDNEPYEVFPVTQPVTEYEKKKPE